METGAGLGHGFYSKGLMQKACHQRHCTFLRMTKNCVAETHNLFNLSKKLCKRSLWSHVSIAPPCRRCISSLARIVATQHLHMHILYVAILYSHLRSHRSATRGDLMVPRTRTAKMGPRSFYVSGPTLWNSLPLELRSYELTLETFKAKLKFCLFRSAYI